MTGKNTGIRSKLTVKPVENVFRTRSESANRASEPVQTGLYRSFRTGPENFPILFGFDASKGISCSESSVAGNFERNFHFRNFRIFHRWPVVGYHGLSVRVQIIQISQI